MPRQQVSREQLQRWRPIIQRIRCFITQGNPLGGFRLASEFATNDAEFATWWLCQVETYEEPIRGRALSFLHRLATRPSDWNFDIEFRRSFN